jgi:cell division protein FtsW
MLGLQATINMAVATVSVPTKGMSLPLVSAGGSGLVITCAALGLLYSVMRFEHDGAMRARAAPAEPSEANGKRRRPSHRAVGAADVSVY